MISTKQAIFPDVFLAGAPKSGTTVLFDLLAAHERIQPADPKEPFFFIDADNPHNQCHLRNAKSRYEDFYHVLDSKFLHLDGTSQTMYQEEVLTSLASLSKKPKAIFILREPGARILSSYKFTSNNLASFQGISFNDYADLLLKGRTTEITKYCKNQTAIFSMTSELLFSDYHRFLVRWRNALGADNLCILLFEDLLSDPQTSINKVTTFLGIDNLSVPQDLPKSNESVSIRNRQLHYYLHQIYTKLGGQIPFRTSLKDLYHRVQGNGDAGKAGEADISALKQYFKTKNDLLARDFHLDLSPW